MLSGVCNSFKYSTTFVPCTSLGICPVDRVWRTRALPGPRRPCPTRRPSNPSQTSACSCKPFTFRSNQSAFTFFYNKGVLLLFTLSIRCSHLLYQSFRLKCRLLTSKDYCCHINTSKQKNNMAHCLCAYLLVFLCIFACVPV